MLSRSGIRRCLLRGLASVVVLVSSVSPIWAMAPQPKVSAVWETWKNDPSAPRPDPAISSVPLADIKIAYDDATKTTQVTVGADGKLSDEDKKSLQVFWPKWVDYAIRNVPDLSPFVEDMKQAGLTFDEKPTPRTTTPHQKSPLPPTETSPPRVSPPSSSATLPTTDCVADYGYMVAGRRWRCCRSVCLIPLVKVPLCEPTCGADLASYRPQQPILASAAAEPRVTVRVARIPTAKPVVFAETAMLASGLATSLDATLTSTQTVAVPSNAEISPIVSKELAADARESLLRGDLPAAAMLAEDAVRQDRENMLAWSVRAVCALRAENRVVAEESIQVVADAMVAGTASRTALLRQLEKVQGADRARFERELLRASLRSKAPRAGTAVAAAG